MLNQSAALSPARPAGSPVTGLLRVWSVLWFFLRFVLIFGLLMAAFYPFDLKVVHWPGVGEAYGRLFRSAGNAVFATFGPHGRVDLSPMPEGPAFAAKRRLHDTDVQLENTQRKVAAGMVIQSRVIGYQPLAFIIALIVATPLPWRRRLAALTWGVPAVVLLVGLRLWLTLLLAMSTPALGVYTFGPTLQHVVGILEYVLVRSFAGSYVLPLCIWFVASFRLRDFKSQAPAQPAMRLES